MDKPDKKYPSPPATSVMSTPSQMPIFIPDPSIRGKSFDQLLAQRGIRMMHHKAIPCMNIQPDTGAHPANCQFCDDSGIIYYDVKEIWGVFSGNSLEKTFETHGVWEIGTAVITLPSEYPDGEQADFNTYDRLELPDFTVRLWELKQYEPRPNNIQKLRYPVKKIEFASSITNNTQTLYHVGVDFNITPSGEIEWISGREPKYDHDLERGEVVGFAYYAHPVYTVLQPLRELRITQEMVNGVKQATRLPQQVLVKRDFLVGKGEDRINSSPVP